MGYKRVYGFGPGDEFEIDRLKSDLANPIRINHESTFIPFTIVM